MHNTPTPVFLTPIQLTYTPHEARRVIARLTEAGMIDATYMVICDYDPLSTLQVAIASLAESTVGFTQTDTALTVTIRELNTNTLDFLDQLGEWIPDTIHALYPNPQPGVYTVVNVHHGQLMVGTIAHTTLAASTTPYQHD